jgi:hypothetical protein
VIIGVILVAGGIVLYPELTKMFSNHSSLDAVAQDLGDLKDTTVERVNYEFDKTADSVGDKIEQITPDPDEINPIKKIQEKLSVPQPKQDVYYGEVYEKDEQNNCKISVPKMAKTVNGVQELTHIIVLPDCQYQKRQPVQVAVATDSQNTSTIAIDSIPQTKIFETLKLTTTKTDDNSIGVYYEDTSNKTLKITVTLRNVEKQLFSGEFITSKFDTTINDVSTSPHIIEMIVEHADYGTVSSSVYNPQENDEATIYGVFTK